MRLNGAQRSRNAQRFVVPNVLLWDFRGRKRKRKCDLLQRTVRISARSLRMQKARRLVFSYPLLSCQHFPTFSPVRAGCSTCFGQRHQHQNIAYFTLGLFTRTSNPSTSTLILIIAHRLCCWKSADEKSSAALKCQQVSFISRHYIYLRRHRSFTLLLPPMGHAGQVSVKVTQIRAHARLVTPPRWCRVVLLLHSERPAAPTGAGGASAPVCGDRKK